MVMVVMICPYILTGRVYAVLVHSLHLAYTHDYYYGNTVHGLQN